MLDPARRVRGGVAAMAGSARRLARGASGAGVRTSRQPAALRRSVSYRLFIWAADYVPSGPGFPRFPVPGFPA
jgi:hypothetical protein